MYVSAMETFEHGALAGVTSIVAPDGRQLGASLGKKVRKTVKRAGRGVKRIAKTKAFQYAMAPFTAGMSIASVRKGAKKALVKYGPYVAIAAQALNLVVPGLGVAVGAAIAAGSTALQAKEAKKQVKEAEKQALSAQAAETQAMADEQMNSAYTTGEKYFTEKYGMSRDKWTALPYDDKLKFVQNVVYDQNQEQMAAEGVTREQFMAMPVEEQNSIVAALGETEFKELSSGERRKLTAELASAVGEPVPEEGLLGLPLWAWLAIGGTVVVGIPVVVMLARRKAA